MGGITWWQGRGGVERDGGWAGLRTLCACGFYLHWVASMHRSLMHTCRPPPLGQVGGSLHGEGGEGDSFQLDNRTLTELEDTGLMA